MGGIATCCAVSAGLFAFGGVHRELSGECAVHTESFDDHPGESLVTTTWTETAGKATRHIVVAFESQAVRGATAGQIGGASGTHRGRVRIAGGVRYRDGTGMVNGAGESDDKLDERARQLVVVHR